MARLVHCNSNSIACVVTPKRVIPPQMTVACSVDQARARGRSATPLTSLPSRLEALPITGEDGNDAMLMRYGSEERDRTARTAIGTSFLEFGIGGLIRWAPRRKSLTPAHEIAQKALPSLASKLPRPTTGRRQLPLRSYSSGTLRLAAKWSSNSQKGKASLDSSSVTP